MPRIKDFSVIVHGFYFRNNFVNRLHGPGFAIPVTEGLCGGMSLAVFNYFRQGLPIPTHIRHDFGTPEEVPPQGSRLWNYIMSQQIGSFASAIGFVFVQWWPVESDNDYSKRHFSTSLNAFYQVRKAIDDNKFVLLGLRALPNRGAHQVLAFGYDFGMGPGKTQKRFKRIYIYDSNSPTRERVLLFNEDTNQMLWDITDDNRDISLAQREYWSCFSQLDLDHNNEDILTENNRPHYLDLTLTEPIKLNGNPIRPKGTQMVRIGDHLTIKATIRNTGDYDTEVKSLLLWAKDPALNNRSYDFGKRLNFNRKIKPGEEMKISTTVQFSKNDKPGPYRFGVSYKSAMDAWLDISLGTQNGDHFISATLLETVKPKVQAAILWPNNKAYFFNEDNYKKFDFGPKKVLDTYPRKIEGAWGQSSAGFFTDAIDAALVWPGNKKAYLFKGDEYLRYDIKKDTMDSGYPKKIKDKWGNWPASFTSVDAVVLWPNRAIYFFKGDEYIRYSIEDDRVENGFPRKITASWGSWPTIFEGGVDAALLSEYRDKIYFFKDESYIKFDLNNARVDNGYPIDISRGWAGL